MNEPAALLNSSRLEMPMRCTDKTDETRVLSVLSVPLAWRSFSPSEVSSVLSVRFSAHTPSSRWEADSRYEGKNSRAHGGTKT